jgi:hypothetical protein
MISIKDFCVKHDACTDGREWALTSCEDMQEAWNTAKSQWLIWIATREGVLTDKELRLFAVFCARQTEHLLTDDRSKTVIDVAERYAHGQATDAELIAASAAARAASDAAWAASDAARAASDASDAAWAAAWAAASAASDAAQSQWLRDNCKPDFSKAQEGV